MTDRTPESGGTVLGRVEALLIAPEGGAPMRRVGSVRSDGLRGLEGDRYARGTGYWSHHRWEPVTLVSAETLATVSRALGREVAPEDVRRNVVTTGVELQSLTGRIFRIGSLTLEGTRPCDPCEYLEGVSGIPGLREGLVGRGGLRAVLRSPGAARVGDPVVAVATKDVVDSALPGP